MELCLHSLQTFRGNIWSYLVIVHSHVIVCVYEPVNPDPTPLTPFYLFHLHLHPHQFLIHSHPSPVFILVQFQLYYNWLLKTLPPRQLCNCFHTNCSSMLCAHGSLLNTFQLLLDLAWLFGPCLACLSSRFPLALIDYGLLPGPCALDCSVYPL